MKHIIRITIILLLFTSVVVMPAAAHEGREVGEYLLTFGWRVEPAYAGQINGPEIRITTHRHEEGDHHDGEAAHEPLEVSLQAHVVFGPETKTITFRPAWGEEGHYIADLIPTIPGDYTFHVFGTIGTTTVEETFSSADGEFSSVEPVDDILFPAVVPASDVEARIAALEARIAALEAQLAAGE